MKKLKVLVLCLSSIMCLAGCGTSNPSVNNSSKPGESSLNSNTNNSVSSADSISSTSKPSSTQNSTSKSSAPTLVNTSQEGYPKVPTSLEGDLIQARDYKIFDKAPEIRFTCPTDPTNNFATRPNKDSDKPEVTGTISTTNCDTKFTLTDVDATMKVRGNYTTNYQKKPFRIKFSAKQNLFGLNSGKKFKKWVLLADVKDSAMLRNSLAFYLARNIYGDSNNPYFVSDFTPVHLYLNNSYWGLYLLAEQKEVQDGRVSINKVADNYTGTDIGYFFEMDHYYSEETSDPTFTVNYRPAMINQHHSGENFVQIEQGYTMGSDTYGNAQVPFLKNRVELAYEIMYRAVYYNDFREIQNEKLVQSTETDIVKCLEKTIDITSFVNMYILHEITCDPDVGYSSFYFSLDMSATGNKLLTLNNPWDWDSALGVRAKTVENSKGMYAANSSNHWLTMLTRCDFFKKLVAEKWAKLTEDKVFLKALGMIEDYSTTYVNEYAKNFQKWPGTIGSNREVDFEVRNEVKQFKTEKQAETFLYNWFKARIEYLNTTMPFGILHDSGKYNSGSEGQGGQVSSGGANEAELTAYKATCNKTRLEAEAGTIIGNAKARTNVMNDGCSNNGYIGDMDGNPGAGVTLTFNSPKAAKALIYAGFSARLNSDSSFAGLYNLSINNVDVTSSLFERTFPAGSGSRDYHIWSEAELCYVNLKAGANTFTITAKNSSSNFDYIDVYLPK